MYSPYRIRHYVNPSQGHILSMATDSPAANQDKFQGYLDRLMRMIPGEVVALYLVGAGFIPKTDRLTLLIWSIVCCAGLIALRTYGSRDPETGKDPQPASVIVSSIAFVIWLYSIGGPFAAYNLHVPYIGSLLVLAWTFFIPIFYKGEPVPRPST